ncbi:hypothetical protein N7523_006772 [Penicillium sp. IBT 18751x]|nr:hypothetical protein N7523_006772 [Penicillium sp. IBT 18751x]
MHRFARACARPMAFGIRRGPPRSRVFELSREYPFQPCVVAPKRYSSEAPLHHQLYEIPPSRLESKIHPLGWEAIQSQTEPWIDQHWTFASEKEKNGFFALGMSRAFSQFFPLTLDDRVEMTCKLHCLIFLIDDQLEKMDLLEMLSYRNRVMQVARGQTKPDKAKPYEWMLFEIFQLMKSTDEALAKELIEGFCALLQAQTAEDRMSVKHLGPYLQLREVDVGRTFYTALIRFGAGLHLHTAELSQTAALESCAFRFMGVLNDIYSWDRESKVYQANPTDGSRPFSSVYILSQETGLSYTACKRLMYAYCRELEIVLKQSSEDLKQEHGGTLRPEMEKYTKGLEYLMSGIEQWSQWTPRYRQ